MRYFSPERPRNRVSFSVASIQVQSSPPYNERTLVFFLPASTLRALFRLSTTNLVTAVANAVVSVAVYNSGDTNKTLQDLGAANYDEYTVLILGYE